MIRDLYNPFDTFEFDSKTCFLTGEHLENPIAYSVFPTWVLDEFGLRNQPFKMLDESYKLYEELTIPCSPHAMERLVQLDTKVSSALHLGYDALKSMDETVLFQWIAKWVYGIIFNEIQMGIQQQERSGEAMNFSQVLVQKFSNLHKMLQSALIPTEFETLNPFSVYVFPVKNAEDYFNYRDEINTLVFSLRMKDFGIIACLQDNGTNGKYHEDVLSLVGNKPLHPIQFEEICARFFYSCYLFNRLPEYTISPTEEQVFIEPLPLIGLNPRPVFDHWQEKTYGQVLENFWKPWGFTLFEIIKDPQQPMSFLVNKQGEFLSPNEISLPV